MSVGPLGGLAGSAAGSQLAQVKGSDAERAQQDNGVHQRRTQSAQKAESAAGVGETDGSDHETAERDADGRLPWRMRRHAATEAAEEPPPKPPKDPTGQSGNELDLSG